MKKQLEEIGKSIKESLLKEVQENNKQMEEKINNVMGQGFTPLEPVWNDCAFKDTQGKTVKMTPTTKSMDLRAIMNETKNEQLNEANDLKLRACNFIIHGVKEGTSLDKIQAKCVHI